MSKRNFILLIIILVVIISGFLFFLYSRPTSTTPGDTTPGTNFFDNFFNPFGTKPTPPVVKPPVDVSGYSTPYNTPGTLPSTKLTKVSSMPVAGFTVYKKERLKAVLESEPAPLPPVKPVPPATEFVPALRYVAKTNGNVYQTFADKIEERKFSSTTIPKVYDAYLGNQGNSVAMRYLKADNRTIETFVGTLPKELLGVDSGAENEIKGSFLPDNVKDISLSPDSSKMFYMFETGDTMIGTTLDFLNNKKVQIFDSPFTEWMSQWPNSNTITLTTKPSGNVGGYMYSFDLGKKSMVKTLGNVGGLTTLESPNGKLILFGDSGLSLKVYHTDTRNSDLLGIRTLPEKCVWGNTSEAVYCAAPKLTTSLVYPDAWYQGEVSFNDQIWKIDIKTGNTTLILDPATALGGQEIDGIKLAVDSDENYLFFIDKQGSFLWKVELK